MNLYIDIIFAVNMTMNAIIFSLVAKVSKYKPGIPRVLIGAAVSATLYCVLLVFLMHWFNPVTAVAILILGLFATFGAVGFKSFVLLVLYAHGIAFFMGGMALALFHYVNTDVIFGVARHFPMGFLFWSVLGSYMALQIGYLSLKKWRMRKQMICQLTLTEGNHRVAVKVLVDTGNSLHDPHNHWPVIIIEETALHQVVSAHTLTTNTPQRVRLIPYKTIGNEGLLTGFVPEQLELVIENHPPISLSQVVIGLCQFTLSKAGNYQGLIGPGCLESQQVT